MLDYYFSLLGDIPSFLEKYLKVPSLVRLKKVGYFCGMDYASKDVYDFSEYISRFDHSLTVALLTYKFTKRKKDTISALFHDIATPCFSHVIDYMNKDYEKQESTEIYTEKILREDTYLDECLKKDHINIEDIINFKKYPVVDNDRPKMCADRIDGVILTSIGWTKNITKEVIKQIVDDLTLYNNEAGEPELGFKSISVAKRVKELSKQIDLFCHSNEDNYMMELLANITREVIFKKIINYDDLYYLNEDELINIISKEPNDLYYKFKNIRKEDIPLVQMPNIKVRLLNPLVGSLRVK